MLHTTRKVKNKQENLWAIKLQRHDQEQESGCSKGELEDSQEKKNEREKEWEKWWQVIFHLSLSWQLMLFPILFRHMADPI